MPKSRVRKKARFVPPAAPTATPTNPTWWAPVMVSLMVAGLAWVVVTYISQSRWPIPAIGSWNLAVGFAMILAGFSMTMRWH